MEPCLHTDSSCFFPRGFSTSTRERFLALRLTDKVAPELDAIDAVRDGAVARPRRLKLQRPHLRLCCPSHSRLIPAPESRAFSHGPIGENDGRTDRSGIGGGRILDELPLPPRLVRDHGGGEGEDL